MLSNFDETNVESLIFLAVEDYIRLLKKSPVELQVYQLWFLAIYPHKITDKDLIEILKIIKSTFPDIVNLKRTDRLVMGKKVLLLANADQELMDDVRTEN